MNIICDILGFFRGIRLLNLKIYTSMSNICSCYTLILNNKEQGYDIQFYNHSGFTIYIISWIVVHPLVALNWQKEKGSGVKMEREN